MPRKVLTVGTPEQRDCAAQVEITISARKRRHNPSAAAVPGCVEMPGSTARIPRVTRLMALAIKFQDMVDRGEVRDYANIARLGYVTRARVTQIMNLLLLSPDIQEMLIFPVCEQKLSERQIRTAIRQILWASQRALLGADR
jgi:hypothetical protein